MQKRNHWQFKDQELEQTFADFKLKPGMFSHEAHLRLAYIHIKKYGVEQAEINMCRQIKGFAESLGVHDKFNLTVTIASVKTMNHFIQKAKSPDFKEFINEFPQLLTDFKAILAQHYGFNVFADQRAKKEFIQPDLLPF